jgi:conjugal transfer mating pair stabilization protein TraG
MKSYKFIALFSGTFLFLIPSASYAASAYEVTTYGNGQFIGEVLNSIAILAGGGDLNGLLRLGLVIGLLVTVLGIMFQNRFNPAWFFAAVIVYLSLFGVKVDVAINDKLDPSADKVIGSVPAGIGIFASVTSKIGDALTRLMESAFTIPGSLQYASNGYLQGADLMRRSTNFIIPEPNIRRSFIDFIRNCTFYDILDGTVSEDKILKSSNLLNDLATDSTHYAQIYVSDSCAEIQGLPDLMLCRDAYPRIKNCINSYYPQWLTTLENSIFGTTTGTLEGLLGDSYSYLANLSFSARDTIIQNALINVFGDAFKAQAAATGADATLLAIAVSEAEAQQKSAFVVMGEMAKKTLPVIRGLLQGMMYGIFPIILFLMMTPFISRVFPTYLTILLWLEFWNPIYAIVNLFANLSMSRALPGLVEGQLSILTNPALAHETQTAVAVAGLATLIVPFIAYFIVSQSQYAIVGALGQILGPTTGLGQGAGASTALGNISLGNASLGNASFNNITANKDDRTSLHTRGYIDRFSGYGDSPAIETNVGSFPFQVTGSTDLNTQIGERVSKLRSSALSNVTRSAESLSSQIGQLSRVGDNYSQVRNLRTGETISLSAQQADSLNRLESIAEDIRRTTGVDRNTALNYALTALGAKELGLSGGLGGRLGLFGGSGIGIIPNLRGGISGQTQYRETQQDNTQLSKSLQKAIDSADKSDYSTILGITDRFGKSTDLLTSTQGGAFGGKERSAGITEARGYFNEASSQLQQAESLQRIQATTVSGGIGTSFNLTPEIVRQFGNDPEALNRAFYDYVHNPESYNAQRFGKAISDYRQRVFNEQRFGGTPTIAAGVGIIPPNVDRNKLEQLKLKQPETRDSVREFGEEEIKSIGSGGVSLPPSLQVDEKIEGIRGNVEYGHENIHSDRGNLQTEFGGEKSKAQGEVYDFNPGLPRVTGNATLGFDPEHGKRANEVDSDPYSPQVYQKEIPEPGGKTKTVTEENPAKEELKSLDEKVVVPEEYRKKGK